jgi:hypothetical protein
MIVICDLLREGPRSNEAVAIGEELRSAGGTLSRFVMLQVMVDKNWTRRQIKDETVIVRDAGLRSQLGFAMRGNARQSATEA